MSCGVIEVEGLAVRRKWFWSKMTSALSINSDDPWWVHVHHCWTYAKLEMDDLFKLISISRGTAAAAQEVVAMNETQYPTP